MWKCICRKLGVATRSANLRLCIKKLDRARFPEFTLKKMGTKIDPGGYREQIIGIKSASVFPRTIDELYRLEMSQFDERLNKVEDIAESLLRQIRELKSDFQRKRNR